MKSPQIKPVVLWFKKDLRLHDHAPLLEAVASKKPILPLYLVEPDYWKLPDASQRHWQFIHDSLLELDDELFGQLTVLQGDAIEALEWLHSKTGFSDIFSHEETGNLWTYKRDIKVKKWCSEKNILWHESPCNGVVRKLKSRDEWSTIHQARISQSILLKPNAIDWHSFPKTWETPNKDNAMFGEILPSVQEGGRSKGVEVLDSFLNHRAQQYRFSISKPAPAEIFCSRISSHLTYGTLSIKEVFQSTYHKIESNKLDPNLKKHNSHLRAFLSRLHWHCHFIQKLEDQPEIEISCIHPLYEKLRDINNQTFLEEWYRGQTGYPLVDACMRSLHKTGWLNFRMRAMVVSFASYQLWLDWRTTGPLLAKLFTDYEPGIHYSQLQMQSGVTGMNAIRMYNPVKQSYDHDSDASFIKRHLPEISDLPLEYIHEPWKIPPLLLNQYNTRYYPAPIIDYQNSTTEARERLAVVRKEKGYRSLSKKAYQKLGSRKNRAKPQKPESNQLELF